MYCNNISIKRCLSVTSFVLERKSCSSTYSFIIDKKGPHIQLWRKIFWQEKWKFLRLLKFPFRETCWVFPKPPGPGDVFLNLSGVQKEVNGTPQNGSPKRPGPEAPGLGPQPAGNSRRAAGLPWRASGPGSHCSAPCRLRSPHSFHSAPSTTGPTAMPTRDKDPVRDSSPSGRGAPRCISTAKHFSRGDRLKGRSGLGSPAGAPS